jgi:hypothetical protein
MISSLGVNRSSEFATNYSNSQYGNHCKHSFYRDRPAENASAADRWRQRLQYIHLLLQPPARGYLRQMLRLIDDHSARLSVAVFFPSLSDAGVCYKVG